MLTTYAHESPEDACPMDQDTVAGLSNMRLQTDFEIRVASYLMLGLILASFLGLGRSASHSIFHFSLSLL